MSNAFTAEAAPSLWQMADGGDPFARHLISHSGSVHWAPTTLTISNQHLRQQSSMSASCMRRYQ